MQECFAALHMAHQLSDWQELLHLCSEKLLTSDIDVLMVLAQFVDQRVTNRMGGGSAGNLALQPLCRCMINMTYASRHLHACELPWQERQLRPCRGRRV